ncbi:hypothetical protein KTD13_01870 [Burkholderia multivorans]|uniref:hypothetical protein n=1 Tax=Burkholderia multivorans TaxID=87883 RepID=UPI001C247BA2|nr:hypothetical protein [Burkholderia multivorans]MBU9259094.1 hypothetical protein [Burkholderia multivorans]
MNTQTNTPTSTGNVNTAAEQIAGMLTDDLTVGNTTQTGSKQNRDVEPHAGHPDSDPEQHEEETEQDESTTDAESTSDDDHVEEAESDDESNGEAGDDHDSIPDDTTFTIRDGDKEVPVTLAELKKGYQRQSDYTKKLQALSEDRKAVMQEVQTAQAEREQYRTGLEQLSVVIQQLTPQEPTAEQWAELQAADPQQWLVLREQWREHKEQMDRVAAEYQALTQRQQAEMQRAIQARMAEEAEKLHAAFPEWKDQAKAQAGKQAIREYAHQYGYSDDEINSTTDHRIFVLAHKAMMYDRMMKKGAPRPDAQPQTSKTKIVRPGTAATAPNSKRSAVQDAKRQLRSSGKVQDAASLLEKLL